MNIYKQWKFFSTISYSCMKQTYNNHRTFQNSTFLKNEINHVPTALRNTKHKSVREHAGQYFVDIKQVRVTGGKGGDGVISFLRLWVNDRAGPDGGDGGNGGHVLFKVSTDISDLSNIHSTITASNGENGRTKNCYGKNADNVVVKVPVGTIVRDVNGKILADLHETGMIFIAAKGGAGGHGNTFFKCEINQAPKVCEFGAEGESIQYVLEIQSMADIGLIGLPNAGKSTLLRAITRAKPKVASYPFTTLKPYVGMIQYDDYEQVAVADLPGLIEDSHKNKGLGIMFLKHAERCAALMFILDVTQESPWDHYKLLKYEIEQFNANLSKRPRVIIANKIDLPGAEEKLQMLQKQSNIKVIPISAKMGTNISTLLKEIRILRDEQLKNTCKSEQDL